VALGLESVRPEILAALNKRMTLGDFQRAVTFLRGLSIHVRAFILLKPPFQSEDEGIAGALEAVEFAFCEGVECCSIVPTRAGNGIMEQLQSQGAFSPPRFESLERVLEDGLRIGQGRGRVFIDLWDAESLVPCPRCGPARLQRLARMNLTQTILPSVSCPCGTT
jgi:archaeosine synthase beta-subunit